MLPLLPFVSLKIDKTVIDSALSVWWGLFSFFVFFSFLFHFLNDYDEALQLLMVLLLMPMCSHVFWVMLDTVDERTYADIPLANFVYGCEEGKPGQKELKKIICE